MIELNSIEKTVKLRTYNRESLEQALKDYAELEEKAAEGKKIEPVLVSAGPLEKLRQAYPNFFLDINEFIQITSKIVEKAEKKVKR